MKRLLERHRKFHNVVIRQRRPQLAIGLGSPDNEQAQPTSEAEIPTLPSVCLPELRFSSFLPIGDSSSVMAFCIFSVTAMFFSYIVAAVVIIISLRLSLLF